MRFRVSSMISRIAEIARASNGSTENPLMTQSIQSDKTSIQQFTWGIDNAAEYRLETAFADSSPAKGLVLERSDGITFTLDQLAGSITLILLASHEMSILPGIWHRISRRAETLGHGVRLVCVVELPSAELPSAFIDRDRQVSLLAGRHEAPILLSLDRLGNVFDVVSNTESIMDWLWNDPRPLSMRANGAVALDDLVV